MYGMSIYQAPQVPQPAVTFGGGNYVDLSTVNMLQAQNAALQQENVALKSANQSLQQQRENPLCKAANRAYLREFTAYKTESLVEFPRRGTTLLWRWQWIQQGRYVLPYLLH